MEDRRWRQDPALDGGYSMTMMGPSPMTEQSDASPDEDYAVRTCAPGDLTDAEMKACIGLVSAGGAVQKRFAEAGLRNARLLAVVRKGNEVVAVGAIKRVRHDCAAGKAKASGHKCPTGTPELGDVARHPVHQGHGFAPRIVAALVAEYAGPLFATTDSQGMKAALGGANFQAKGREWKGERGKLSLWLKEPSSPAPRRSEPAPSPA